MESGASHWVECGKTDGTTPWQSKWQLSECPCIVPNTALCALKVPFSLKWSLSRVFINSLCSLCLRGKCIMLWKKLQIKNKMLRFKWCVLLVRTGECMPQWGKSPNPSVSMFHTVFTKWVYRGNLIIQVSQGSRMTHAAIVALSQSWPKVKFITSAHVSLAKPLTRTCLNSRGGEMQSYHVCRGRPGVFGNCCYSVGSPRCSSVIGTM